MGKEELLLLVWASLNPLKAWTEQGQREGVTVRFVTLTQSRLTREDSLKEEFTVNIVACGHI